MYIIGWQECYAFQQPHASAKWEVPKAPCARSHGGERPIHYSGQCNLSAETGAPADAYEALEPARGILLGLLFSLPVWSVIGFLIWFLLGR